MREQIAKTINRWFHPADAEDGFQVADQILALLREEIEKVENPYRSNGSGFNLNTHRADGYDDACQKILALLEERR